MHVVHRYIYAGKIPINIKNKNKMHLKFPSCKHANLFERREPKPRTSLLEVPDPSKQPPRETRSVEGQHTEEDATVAKERMHAPSRADGRTWKYCLYSDGFVSFKDAG